MAANRSSDDLAVINTLTIGEAEEFRRWIYSPAYIEANAAKFMTTDWVDIDQLRLFRASRGTTTRVDSPPPIRVKQEPEPTQGTLLLDSPVRTRVHTNGTIEILCGSDSEGEEEPEERAPPLAPSEPEALDTEMTAQTPAASSVFDEYVSSTTDVDDYDPVGTRPASPADEEEDLPPPTLAGRDLDEYSVSERVWLDDNVTSRVVYDGEPIKLTRSSPPIHRIELLTEIPSIWPNPATPTAFVLYAHDKRFRIRHKSTNELLTIDALIKNKDNDSWRGSTGVGQSTAKIRFAPGEPEVEARRSTLNCKGKQTCPVPFVAPDLAVVVRRDLDPDARDDIITTEQDVRGREGNTSVSSAAQFLIYLRGLACKAVDAAGNRCTGNLIPVRKRQYSRGHLYMIGCSGRRSGFTNGHILVFMPDNVDETLVIQSLAGMALSEDPVLDVRQCATFIHPKTGGRRKKCHVSHIVQGRPAVGRIMELKCRATRYIYVPIASDDHRALIFHGPEAHSHPIPALTKLSYDIEATYEDCVLAHGAVGATVAKVDTSSAAKLLLKGKSPAEYSQALVSQRAKQKIIDTVKKKQYPKGTGFEGALWLLERDAEKPVSERYVHRAVMLGAGRLIVTGVPASIKLIDHLSVTSIQADMTFKRVVTDGFNEVEVVIYYKPMQTSITVVRIYVVGQSTEIYERAFDELASVKIDVTGKPLAFKRLVEDGNLVAFLSDMDSAQVLGAAASILKTNDSAFSKIPSSIRLEEFASYIIKLCITHAKRAVLDFDSLVTDEAAFAELMDFVYLESEDEISRFSDLVATIGKDKIRSWWKHKTDSPWILACLLRFRSNILREDWDSTPSTTNLGEARHAYTNRHTGIKLTLVEAIESARELDERDAREMVAARGVLRNPQNEGIHRLGRNTTRAATAVRKRKETAAMDERRGELDKQIAAEDALRRAAAAKAKALKDERAAIGKGGRGRGRAAGDSSSGRVKTRNKKAATSRVSVLDVPPASSFPSLRLPTPPSAPAALSFPDYAQYTMADMFPVPSLLEMAPIPAADADFDLSMLESFFSAPNDPVPTVAEHSAEASASAAAAMDAYMMQFLPGGAYAPAGSTSTYVDGSFVQLPISAPTPVPLDTVGLAEAESSAPAPVIEPGSPRRRSSRKRDRAPSGSGVVTAAPSAKRKKGKNLDWEVFIDGKRVGARQLARDYPKEWEHYEEEYGYLL
ncbi:hypothetical protein MKEN_00845200 [Mycena kentingensis (nom. inval.)]|nr:hypothetical protein MKEN_00845200 [Mycena kentingensis (nom. inval.)]